MREYPGRILSTRTVAGHRLGHHGRIQTNNKKKFQLMRWPFNRSLFLKGSGAVFVLVSGLFAVVFNGVDVVAAETGFDNGIEEAVERSLNNSLFWGTYRPNVYFGVRSRSPNGLNFGIAWFSLDDYQSWQQLRHMCEMGDDLTGQDYEYHDGRTFAVQNLRDPKMGIDLQTEFLKYDQGDLPNMHQTGDWSARISGKTNGVEDRKISLIIYGYSLDYSSVIGRDIDTEGEFLTVGGTTPDLGDFKLTISSDGLQSADMPIPVLNSKVTEQEAFRIKEIIQADFRKQIMAFQKSHDQNPTSQPPPPSELLQLQDSLDVHFTASAVQKKDIVAKSKNFDKAITERKKQFEAKFNRVYQLKQKGYDERYQEMGRVLVSNLVGGIGYFYGKSIVDVSQFGTGGGKDFFNHQDDDLESMFLPDKKPEAVKAEEEKPKAIPEEVGPYELLTATPSRTFFPRGFFWDEGFHQSLLMHWDPQMSVEIIKSWMALQNDDGWIAREQILGLEARSKVPQEFQMQNPTFANPPTMVLPLLSFLETLHESNKIGTLPPFTDSNESFFADLGKHDDKLLLGKIGTIFGNLERHFQWMRKTQSVIVPSRFLSSRFKDREFFGWTGRTRTHCFTSGMDDYPRGPSPNEFEANVDLMTWMAAYAQTLSQIAKYLGRKNESLQYGKLFEQYSSTVNDLFWSEEQQAFGDLIITETGETEIIVNRGYLSLFPFLFGLIPADSGRLKHVLDMIEDRRHLWTDYGLRSLSPTDEYYGQHENYWRGPIWVNINYLALRSLKRYYLPSERQTHQEQSQRIYANLRKNLVDNLLGEYQRTGYFWEQYNSTTGQGQRSHPFTGWTALALNIMAEKY